MAWIRPTDSGRWAATVYLPNGKRIKKTCDLKSQANNWARDTESTASHGSWIDPREGKLTVAQCWETWGHSRRLELASRKRDESHWRCHVEPRWGTTAIGTITQPDIQAWVVEMEAAHRDECADRKCRGCAHGAATIEAAVGVLRAILELAVHAKKIEANPAQKISISPRDGHVDRVLTPEEDLRLLGAHDRHHPGLACGRLMCELMLNTGLRWEEVAALDRDHVDMRKRLVHVINVMERDGAVREYPKRNASRRAVPVGDAFWPTFRTHILTVSAHGMIFTSPRGKNLLYSSWHRRVWLPPLRGATAPVGQGEWSPDRFGGLLDETYAARGITSDAALARAVGISKGILYNWRAGRYQPRRGTLDKINAVLLLPVDELYVAAGVMRSGLEGAGLDDPQPTPHDLRHTYGTRLAEGGVQPHEIMRLMGHEHLESTERYLHAGPGHFDRAREALAGVERARLATTVSRS